MNATTWIAEETLDGSRRSGERFPILVRVGQPYPMAREEWGCAVSVAGLHDELADIRGGSSLQALSLAIELTRQLLASFVEDGGKLMFPGGDHEFDIQACFSHVNDPA